MTVPVPTRGGIVLRVVHRAQQRFVEWLAGFQTMLLGLIFMHDGDTFATSRNFQFFQRIASEDKWAIALFLLGAIRVAGLIVNGARQDITPWIRAAGAFVGFMIFFGFTYGFALSWLSTNGPPAIGMAMFGPAAVAELAAIIYSVRDAKAYRNGHGIT